MVLGVSLTVFAFVLLTDGPATEVANNWSAAIESHDLESLLDLYSEDATWNDPAFGDYLTGREGVRIGWGIFSLPGFEVRELELMTVDDHGATVRWILGGSQSQFTGEPWEIEGVSVLEVFDGAIVSETVFYDSAGVRSVP